MNPVLTAKSKRSDDDIITKFRFQLLGTLKEALPQGFMKISRDEGDSVNFIFLQSEASR